MKPILFQKARLIDPDLKMDMRGDLLVENGVVSALGPELLPTADAEKIDCGGAVLAPGLVDLHVHFRDPGQTEKETLETGCAAAANGGFTAVVTMANTKPAVDSPELIRSCIERNRTMDCRIYPGGAVTKGLGGKELTDFEALKEAGAVCLTDDGLTVGAPYVAGASVAAKVVKNGKAKKITVFTYKPKKNSKRKMGHRQPYTKVEISAINA